MRFGRAQQGERLRLGLRNLYILPTRFGWLWLASIVLLHVVGLQTLRNGPLLLSFLMLALLLLSLLLTQFNLQGLELRCGSPAPGFAGEELPYPLELHSAIPREAVRIRAVGQGGDGAQRIPAGPSSLAVLWRPMRRGRRPPGRLLISTTAPLGLFICWTRWDPPTPQLVYPARIAGPVGRWAEAHNDDDATDAAVRLPVRGAEGSEDWCDLRPHRAEDSQARVAWKALAQGRGQLSKVFHDPLLHPQHLAPAAGVEREQALEHLSDWIWQACRRGESYGLALPHHRIPPGQGRRHRDRCLAALALSP